MQSRCNPVYIHMLECILHCFEKIHIRLNANYFTYISDGSLLIFKSKCPWYTFKQKHLCHLIVIVYVQNHVIYHVVRNNHFNQNSRWTFISEGYAWWRHQMETFSALLAIYAGYSPVTGEFLAQRPVTQSFDVFFDLHLNKRLNKQSPGWWFEIPLRPLWRHCNELTRHREAVMGTENLLSCSALGNRRNCNITLLYWSDCDS